MLNDAAIMFFLRVFVLVLTLNASASYSQVYHLAGSTDSPKTTFASLESFAAGQSIVDDKELQELLDGLKADIQAKVSQNLQKSEMFKE